MYSEYFKMFKSPNLTTVLNIENFNFDLEFNLNFDRKTV